MRECAAVLSPCGIRARLCPGRYLNDHAGLTLLIQREDVVKPFPFNRSLCSLEHSVLISQCILRNNPAPARIPPDADIERSVKHDGGDVEAESPGNSCERVARGPVQTRCVANGEPSQEQPFLYDHVHQSESMRRDRLIGGIV
jgi:hypothetical protein